MALLAALALALLLPPSNSLAEAPVLHVRMFSSPDHRVSCEILDAASGGPLVDCNVFDREHNGFHGAFIDASGTSVCNHPSGGRYCGVLGGRFRALPDGRSTEAEGFRCSSERGSIICIRASGKRAGRGFRIDRNRAVKVRRALHKPTPKPSPPEEAAGVSHAQLWSALERHVTCGIFTHLRAPARYLLCAARSIPAPENGDPSIGDPGFVLLGSSGLPQLTRLSQYSWQVGDGVGPDRYPHLTAAAMWGYPPIGVSCAVGEAEVTCTNRAGHGFSLDETTYTGF